MFGGAKFLNTALNSIRRDPFSSVIIHCCSRLSPNNMTVIHDFTMYETTYTTQSVLKPGHLERSSDVYPCTYKHSIAFPDRNSILFLLLIFITIVHNTDDNRSRNRILIIETEPIQLIHCTQCVRTVSDARVQY